MGSIFSILKLQKLLTVTSELEIKSYVVNCVVYQTKSVSGLGKHYKTLQTTRFVYSKKKDSHGHWQRMDMSTTQGRQDNHMAIWTLKKMVLKMLRDFDNPVLIRYKKIHVIVTKTKKTLLAKNVYFLCFFLMYKLAI